MPDRKRTPLVALILLLAGLPLAATAQDTTDVSVGTGDDETLRPGYEIEVESSSHIVRREAERFTYRWLGSTWDFTALYASLTPSFQEGHDQLGLLAGRDFGRHRLDAVVRHTDRSEGEDILGSVRWHLASAGGARFGAEVTAGTADLADDAFVVDDDESQFVGRAFAELASGWSVEAFAVQSGTYDVMRGTLELLERLPRSRIAGAETLADLDVDEDQLEDSAGLRLGFERGRLRAGLYFKSGEQAIRGIGASDDMTGFGAEVHYRGDRLDIDWTLDSRALDTVDGIGFQRARGYLDLRHRIGRYEWGIGSYVQGESETFSEIVDVYSTAGIAATLARRFDSGNWWGVWLIAEDDAPPLQRVSRLAVFRRRGEQRLGVGVRRDETGAAPLAKEELGAFAFAETEWKGLLIDGDIEYQDGEVHGHVTIGVRR